MTYYITTYKHYLMILIILLMGCTSLEPEANIEVTRVTATATRQAEEATALPTATQIPPSLTPTPNPTSTPIVSVPTNKIAFAAILDPNNREIFTANQDGTELVQLTSDVGNSVNPVWSPDGSQIAFRSDRTEQHYSWELYVMNADGSNVRQLTEGGAYVSSIAWSPDGSQIAFARVTGEAEQQEIYLIDADGSHLTRLTDNLAADSHPTWSPDGSQIAFISDRDGDSEIYVMNRDGSQLIQLTDNTEGDFHPAWSPDGSQIAFSRNSDVIYLLDLNTLEETLLVEGTHPTWTPSGAGISFDIWANEWLEARLIDVATQEVEVLAINERVDLIDLRWQPDAQQAPALAQIAIPTSTPEPMMQLDTTFEQPMLFLADYSVQYWNPNTQTKQTVLGAQQPAATVDDLDETGRLTEAVANGVTALVVREQAQIALATQRITIEPATHRLVVIDLQTLETQTLVDNLHCFIKADLAPDGSQLAYVAGKWLEEDQICETLSKPRDHRRGMATVYRLATDGSTPAIELGLCEDGEQTILNPDQPFVYPDGKCGDLSWSADSSQLFWFDTNGLWRHDRASGQVDIIAINNPDDNERVPTKYLRGYNTTWLPNSRFFTMIVADWEWTHFHFLDQETDQIIPSYLNDWGEYHKFLGWTPDDNIIMLVRDDYQEPWFLQQYEIMSDGVRVVDGRNFPVHGDLSDVFVLPNARWLFALYNNNLEHVEPLYENGIYQLDPTTGILEQQFAWPSWMGEIQEARWQADGEGILVKTKGSQWQLFYIPLDGSTIVDVTDSFGLSAHQFHWLP